MGTHTATTIRRSAFVIVLALLLAACGGGGEPSRGDQLAALDDRPGEADSYGLALRRVARACDLNQDEAYDLVVDTWGAARSLSTDDLSVEDVLTALQEEGDGSLPGGVRVDCAGIVPTTTSRPSTSTTTPPSQTVAPGTPCVPLAVPLPEGAPAFEIPLGPPPADLVTEDLVIGDGAEVPAGATVTLNYVGVSCSTGQIFDESYGRGAPATFPLSGLIQGWQDGIPGMRVGGQRLLVIPPDLGYGPEGRPPQILGNETLIFLVSLEGIS